MFILIVAIVAGLSPNSCVMAHPPYIQTRTVTIRRLNSSSSPFTTTLTFSQTYPSQPAVYLSLAALETLLPLSNSTLLQSVEEVSRHRFNHSLTLSARTEGIEYRLTQVQILYLVFSPGLYPFVLLHDLVVGVPGLSADQYLLVDYLSDPSHPITALQTNDTYELNAILSGYQNMVVSSGPPILQIDAHHYNNDSYLLHVKRENVTVQTLSVLRILINVSEMNLTSNQTNLSCETDSILHQSDPNSVTSMNRVEPDRLPFAMLYGIKGWTGYEFNLPDITYIFNNSWPRVQVNIGYLMFHSDCIASYDTSYENTNETDCYELQIYFYYQLTPADLPSCPYECYSCLGPLSTICRSCPDGRYLSAGRCLCPSGFYDPGSVVCLNCSLAIRGCLACESAASCTVCQNGCTPLLFSPIYCDCPQQVQANFSYNCPQGYYFEPDTDSCHCSPQTYLNASSGLCQTCELGCFLCKGSANEDNDYCVVCLDGYFLVDGQCLFYHQSYVLLGQKNSLDSPMARCMQWDELVCLQTCQGYYYQLSCLSSCPSATFPIESPWLSCQKCKINCQSCFNYTICYECQANYFYFNSSTMACSQCSPHCQTCLNNTFCSVCQLGYSLTSNNSSCLAPAPLSPNCPPNCEYCLVGSQCLSCSPSHYLNLTDYLCQNCSNKPGFLLSVSGDCSQTCGDGLVIYAECDDGNVESGDGCSASCEIEQGYRCSILKGQSYCWRDSTAISWQLYNVFGGNQMILMVTSQVDLKHTVLMLFCNFDWELVHTVKRSVSRSMHNRVQDCVKGEAAFTIQYKEPLVLPLDLGSEATLSHIKGIDSANRCYLQVNSLVNYTISVNTVPESLFVDYSSPLETAANRPLLKSTAIAMMMLSLAISILGLTPSSSFVSLRVNMLLLCSYLDYFQLPSNSFTVYQALQHLTFMDESTSTQDLVTFSNDYYSSLLWRSTCLYVVVFLLHQVALPYLARLVDSMDWHYLSRVGKHILSNRALTLNCMATAYELILYHFLFRVTAHLSQANLMLILPFAIQLILIVLSKVHLYHSFNAIKEGNGYLWHSILVDQMQNLSVAVLMQFSTASITYAPCTLILFGCYNLASIVLAVGPRVDPQFRKTELMAVWQYACSLLLFIALQAGKSFVMWRIDSDGYEEKSILMGAVMSLACFCLITVNSLATLVSGIVRLSELKVEPRDLSQDMATVDHSSAEHFSP